MRRVVPTYALLAICAVLSGCGGSSKTPPPMMTMTTPPTTGGPVNAPTVIGVAAGQTSTGVNISVPAPVASPQENAQVLGLLVADNRMAFNTGTTIHRGASDFVIMFGAGLSGNMTVSISGPPGDFIIGTPMTIKATNGTPGIQFPVNVSPTAALGARTVVLQAPNNDITTFTGGLEVVP